MSNFTTFFIARHGETEWNIAKRIQGHLDSNLTEKGRQQAKQLADNLKSVHFDEIFASDSSRAKETAEIIAIERAMAVKTSQALRERGQGRLQGRFGDEVRQELADLYAAYDRLTDEEKLSHHLVEDDETLESVISRFIRYLRETAIAHPGKTILIVTHGGTIRAFLYHIGYAPLEELNSKTIKNTEHIVVQSDGLDFFLKEARVSL